LILGHGNSGRTWRKFGGLHGKLTSELQTRKKIQVTASEYGYRLGAYQWHRDTDTVSNNTELCYAALQIQYRDSSTFGYLPVAAAGESPATELERLPARLTPLFVDTLRGDTVL
jgi:hypothetical protein